MTICAQNRVCLFGEVVAGQMHLNGPGRMASSQWKALASRFPHVELDAFVVMPNHLHGILLVGCHRDLHPLERVRSLGDQSTDSPRTPSLGQIVGSFKSLSTLEYGRGVESDCWLSYDTRLWQRGYHEHIIRGEGALQRIRQYIADNPGNWQTDRENPAYDSP